MKLLDAYEVNLVNSLSVNSICEVLKFTALYFYIADAWPYINTHHKFVPLEKYLNVVQT